MRISRPALEQIREYAAVRGCTELDEGSRRFIAPDRSRAIRISEIQPGTIYLWDTMTGKTAILREGRSTKIKGRQDRLEEKGDKAVPVEGDGGSGTIALVGQLSLPV